jgi:plasmid stabilization system protein ParE
MIERIVYTAEAEQDVIEAYAWYEHRERGLGEDFLRCVEVRLLTLQRHPHAFPVAFDNFRHALIRRFPFEIFYEPVGDCLIVYAIFHCSQDPEKWRQRLGFGPSE